jgi:hypothetical protein
MGHAQQRHVCMRHALPKAQGLRNSLQYFLPATNPTQLKQVPPYTTADSARRAATPCQQHTN